MKLATILIALVILVIALAYLGGALAYPLTPAVVEVGTAGRVSAEQQMGFMITPSVVITVLGILFMGALFAFALGGIGRR